MSTWLEKTDGTVVYRHNLLCLLSEPLQSLVALKQSTIVFIMICIQKLKDCKKRSSSSACSQVLSPKLDQVRLHFILTRSLANLIAGRLNPKWTLLLHFCSFLTSSWSYKRFWCDIKCTFLLECYVLNFLNHCEHLRKQTNSFMFCNVMS